MDREGGPTVRQGNEKETWLLVEELLANPSRGFWLDSCWHTDVLAARRDGGGEVEETKTGGDYNL